jgi:hypothetical protein
MALITELDRAGLPGAAADDRPAPAPTTPPAASPPRRLTVPAQPGLTPQPGLASPPGPTPPRQLDLLELQEQIAQDAEAAESQDAAANGAAALQRQEPYAGLSFGWYFPAERRCAHYARRWFGDLLRATWPDQDAVDSCELAFGEVVANAVVHGGGGAVRVEVRLDERACYFEITDGEREVGFGAPGSAEQAADAAEQSCAAGAAVEAVGAAAGSPAGSSTSAESDTPDPIAPRRAGSLDESGRGLEMLGLLCDRWNVRAAAHGHGKTVSVEAGSVSAH